MFCNVKTKVVFSFKGIKITMIAICFNTQGVNNYNMNTKFVGFKWDYIREFSLNKIEIHII